MAMVVSGKEMSLNLEEVMGLAYPILCTLPPQHEWVPTRPLPAHTRSHERRDFPFNSPHQMALFVGMCRNKTTANLN